MEVVGEGMMLCILLSCLWYGVKRRFNGYSRSSDAIFSDC